MAPYSFIKLKGCTFYNLCKQNTWRHLSAFYVNLIETSFLTWLISQPFGKQRSVRAREPSIVK